MKNKHIFIINGAAGVGKDSFIDSLIISSKELDEFGNIINYSSVDVIKSVAKLLGWSGGKSEIDRKFLSDLKKLSGDYNDLPFTSIIHTVSQFLKSLNDTVLFLHIREPHEIERAKTAFGAKTVLVTRDGVGVVKSNESDANVHNYEYDIIIKNNGSIADLQATGMKFLIDLQFNDIQPKYGD